MRTTEPNEYSKKISGVPTDHKAVGSPVSKDGNIQIDDIKEQNYLGNNVMLYETATGFGRVPTLDDNGKVAKNQIPDSIGSIPITIDGKKVVSMAFNEIIPPPTHSEIYGVDQVGRENPLALPRTDDAVGKTYTLKTVGSNQVYESDFDTCYPWSDITEVTGSKGNTFVRIPKFYHKFTANSNGTYHIQISGFKHDETWLTCFINNGVEIPYMDIGKYEASNSGTLKSVSGVTPLAEKTIIDFRTYATANGTGYHQYDIWNHQVLQLLFLVEFATTNSQEIMRGVSDRGGAINTGSCDGIVTGSPVSITDGTHGCIYRGIENLWGNVNKYCDGINLIMPKVYVSDNILLYNSIDFQTKYKEIGTTVSDANSALKAMAPATSNYPQLMIPSAVNSASSTKTYYCDYFRTEREGTTMCLNIGGYYTFGGWNGLWLYRCQYNYKHSNAQTGSRLCYKPISEV